MTLVEVLMAMAVFALVSAGVMAGMIQSRRLTMGSVAQSSAQAAVESYMEQMESMNLQFLVNSANSNPLIPTWTACYGIPTQQDSTTGSDPLVWSNTGTGTPSIPDITTLTPGVTPTGLGIVDNLKEIPANPNSSGSTTTWNVVWPHANLSTVWTSQAATPTATVNETNSAPKTNNLHMNIWVWITDLSATNSIASSANPNAYAQTVYGITIIYTWQFWDGLGMQYFMGTLHSVRSKVS
jgi:type II secretory pathway pseudopilin PulG